MRDSFLFSILWFRAETGRLQVKKEARSREQPQEKGEGARGFRVLYQKRSVESRGGL